MLDFFKRKSIRTRVMEIVEAKIGDAQKEHDDQCHSLDLRHEADVEEMARRLEDAKEAHADKIVERVLGKP